MENMLKDLRLSAAATIGEDIASVMASIDTSYTVYLPIGTEFKDRFFLIEIIGGAVGGGETVTFDFNASEKVYEGSSSGTTLAFNDTALGDYAFLYCDGNRWHVILNSGGVIS